MPPAAVGVNHDGRCTVKGCLRIRRPAVRINHRRDIRHVGEAALQQQAARAVFVFARRMAGRAGEEDDFLLRSRSGQRRSKE